MIFDPLYAIQTSKLNLAYSDVANGLNTGFGVLYQLPELQYATAIYEAVNDIAPLSLGTIYPQTCRRIALAIADYVKGENKYYGIVYSDWDRSIAVSLIDSLQITRGNYYPLSPVIQKQSSSSLYSLIGALIISVATASQVQASGIILPPSPITGIVLETNNNQSSQDISKVTLGIYSITASNDNQSSFGISANYSIQSNLTTANNKQISADISNSIFIQNNVSTSNNNQNGLKIGSFANSQSFLKNTNQNQSSGDITGLSGTQQNLNGAIQTQLSNAVTSSVNSVGSVSSSSNVQSSGNITVTSSNTVITSSANNNQSASNINSSISTVNSLNNSSQNQSGISISSLSSLSGNIQSSNQTQSANGFSNSPLFIGTTSQANNNQSSQNISSISSISSSIKNSSQSQASINISNASSTNNNLSTGNNYQSAIGISSTASGLNPVAIANQNQKSSDIISNQIFIGNVLNGSDNQSSQNINSTSSTSPVIEKTNQTQSSQNLTSNSSISTNISTSNQFQSAYAISSISSSINSIFAPKNLQSSQNTSSTSIFIASVSTANNQNQNQNSSSISTISASINTALNNQSAAILTHVAAYDSSIVTDVDAQDFFNRLYRNSGTPANSIAQSAIQTFVAGCKTDSIWTLLLDIGVFVGNNLNAALTKLKYVGTYSTYVNSGFVESDFSQATGLAFSSGKSLDTQFNPAIHLGQNISASAHFYSRTSSAAALNTADMIAVDVNGNSTGLYIRYPGTTNVFEYDCYTDVGGTSGYIFASNTATHGLFTGCRTSASALALYRNATALSLPTTSATSATTRTNGNYTMQSNKLCAFEALGTGFTAAQATSLYNRVQAMQTTLGRNV